MMSYDNPEITQLLRQYDMFTNSLNLIKTVNEREMIIKQLTKIEEKVIDLTNAIYEKEYNLLFNKKTGLLDEEKERLNMLIDLVNQRLAYVEKHCNNHYQLTGAVFDVNDVLGATLIDEFEERVRIIDKYNKNIALRNSLEEDIKSLTNKINLASKTIEINNNLNRKLEEVLKEKLGSAFKELNYFDYLDYREEINAAFLEVESCLKLAQSNLEYSKYNSLNLIDECQDMFIEIKQDYAKYKEKTSLLQLMDIYSLEVNTYEELLNKRKEINELMKNIRNEKFNSLVFDTIEEQFNTIVIEAQDINTFNDLTLEKERKISALAEIEKENNSDKFREVLDDLLENERRKQESILEEKRKIELEEKKKKVELEKKKQEEMLKKQKIIEEARKKEIEKRTKEMLEQQQNSILQPKKNEYSFRTMKDMSDFKDSAEKIDNNTDLKRDDVSDSKDKIEKELFDEFKNYDLNFNKINGSIKSDNADDDLKLKLNSDLVMNLKDSSLDKSNVDAKLPDMSIDEYMSSYKNDDKIDDLFLDDTLFPNIPM